MNDKIRKRLDRVTQLDSRNLPRISGICVINGIERPVAAFEVPKGTKASEFEKVLLEQAYTEREYKLTDWMQGAGGMSDLSITGLLFAYGAWVSDNNNELGCKSPSLMLIKSAPKLCKDSVKASKRRVVDFITDDEALAVDRAMNKLMRHSVHLHNIVTYHFIYNWSVKQIADDYWSQFEYPCGKKKATNYHVNPLLNHAIGFINCELINDKACMF